MKTQSQPRNLRRHPAPPSLTGPRASSTIHESRLANSRRLFSRPSSPATRHCLIQSLANHHRKPIQLAESNHQRPRSIARFGVFFCNSNRKREGARLLPPFSHCAFWQNLIASGPNIKKRRK